MCGIFGIINFKKDKLDKRAFNILGINNDSRGGDSCGIFIDGKVEYGVNKLKLYNDFYKKSKLLKDTNTCNIALGHCRKASVGAINEKTAQPVVIYNAEGKADYVLLHNGTIYNFEDLAKKYIPDINIKGMTDSQVMALIFYNKGYDVLSEYQGAGVFVMVDYRKNKPVIMAFKGNSKNSYYSSITSDERPFFFIRNNNRFIFSSIYTYLEALMPESEFFTIKSNHLIVVKPDGVFSIKEYNRKEMWQDKSTGSNNYISYNNYSLYSSYDSDLPLYKGCVYPSEDGTYRHKDTKAHGEYYVSEDGSIVEDNKKNAIKVYFWDGILLYNEECFKFLTEFCVYINTQEEDLKYSFPALIDAFSPYPTSSRDYLQYDVQRGKMCKGVNMYDFELYSGELKMPFSTRVLTFSDGVRTGQTYRCYDRGYKDALNDFLEEVNKFDFNKYLDELDIDK